MLISVIIPVSREGEGLYQRVKDFTDKLVSVAKEYGLYCEVLLITDLFHNQTLKAMGLLAQHGMVRSFLLTRRIGKGGSIKNAIPHARGDYIVLLDADIPISTEILIKVVRLAYATKVDVLVANRIYRTCTIARQVLSMAYNVLVNLLFQTGLRDHQAGFKILSRRAARLILGKRVRTDGLAYDTEIIVWAKKYGFAYRSVNVAWLEQRKGSTIPPLRALLTMLADLLALRLLTLRGKDVALQLQEISKIIELPTGKTVGKESLTVIRTSGPKKKILNALRKLYIAVAVMKG
jgi:glycosyltransferase involved in cell wall biosynthesis